ncbi:hypothetical protein, partial [Mesorhizobium sp. M2E.F.Ca.ET.209.01.1.1]|uniref:hypothetical protein n=3 Tax=Mesorhizobium TaxID=68287 RepID=UPI001AEE013D
GANDNLVQATWPMACQELTMGGAANHPRTLRYVAEITRKLAKMLSRTHYQMLVYLLEMTAVEAESLADAQDPRRAPPTKQPQPRD